MQLDPNIYPEEHRRISFMIERDGLEAAVVWAKLIMQVYRKSVLVKKSFGSKNPWKTEFIRSYLDFKRFYLSNKK